MLFLLISSALVANALATKYYCPNDGNEYTLFSGKSVGKCLLKVTGYFTLDDAISECAELGAAKVVQIDSEALNSAVDEAMGVEYLANVWVGIKEVNGDRTFPYIDGTPLGQYKAFDGPVGLNPDKSCVQRSYDAFSNAVWYVVSCEATSKLVCSKDAFVRTCDIGWSPNDEKDACIKAVKRRKRNFQGARDYCQVKGGDLATKMVTKSQRSHVMRQIKFKSQFWIGVHDPQEDGTFENVDGTQYTPSPPFKKGKPNNTNGRKNCVAMNRKKWHDKDCAKHRYFICQKSPIA